MEDAQTPKNLDWLLDCSFKTETALSTSSGLPPNEINVDTVIRWLSGDSVVFGLIISSKYLSDLNLLYVDATTQYAKPSASPLFLN